MLGPKNIQYFGRGTLEQLRDQGEIWGEFNRVMLRLGFFSLSYSDTAEMGPLTRVRQAASPTHAKKNHDAALDSLYKQMTLLPRITRLHLPSWLFLQGRSLFWGLPLTLYALADLLVFLVASTTETEDTPNLKTTFK